MLELRPHQRKAVEELKNGAILCGGVGSGKTITSLVYFYEKVCGGVVGDYGSLKAPRDLYVVTTAKKRDSLDWDREAVSLGLSRDPEASAGGIKVTVESWNNISKLDDVEGAMFIFDEQRLVGSGTWVKSFLKIAKQNQWIMLSATPGDNWLDYIPVFIANGFYKNRTEFKREHVIYSSYSKFPKVERYVGAGRLLKMRNSILVEMPYERHTTRHIELVKVEYDRELFKKVVKDRWHVYENRPLTGQAELFSVMRRVVNSDDSRVRSLVDFMERHSKIIVFYNFNYELEMLRDLVEQVQRPADTESFVLNTLGAGSSSTSASVVTHSSKKITGEGRSTSSTSTKTGGSRLDLQKEDSKDLRNLGGIPNPTTRPLESGDTSMETEQSSPLIGSQDVQIAEWNGHKHDPIPTSDRWVYLVQYVAGAEGWNCVDTDAMVFYSMTYSYKNFEQAKGRIDRLNTPFSDLYYYVLKSSSPIDIAIWKALGAKKSFQESDFR